MCLECRASVMNAMAQCCVSRPGPQRASVSLFLSLSFSLSLSPPPHTHVSLTHTHFTLSLSHTHTLHPDHTDGSVLLQLDMLDLRSHHQAPLASAVGNEARSSAHEIR